MNLLDLLIVGLVAAAAAGAWRLGFVTRVASWLGVGAGLYVGLRLAPPVVDALGSDQPLMALLVAVAVLLGLAGVGASAGELVGIRLRRRLPAGPARRADRAAGAVVGAVGMLAAAWLVLPVLAEVPGEPARLVRSSTIAALLDDAPRPPDALQTLRRLVAGTDFPQVFADLRPAPDTGPPPPSGILPRQVEARVARSTVKVSGPACGRIQHGSGFTPRPGTVVTNAHVVAGTGEGLAVERPDGRRLAATVVAFDPARDLAVLAVPELGQEPLPIASADVGAEGAVFGHPGGQRQLEISPARITERTTAVGYDIYNRNRTRREVFFLAARLAPGDSGGALVDTAGRVVGVAFAVSPDRPDTAYALTSAELQAILARPVGGPVDTGPCIR